ncbi:thermonuclease family protein [Roseobacter sp.]|uniref:thermonuclease family protein n=1 Tax=Roseobacter sp. TaxID=1907202 RepID=UPI00329A034D
MRTLLIALLAAAVSAPVATNAQAAFSGAVRVVDGDTIDVAGTRVRLFGIDAPEAAQTCTTKQGRAWDCGAWVIDQVTTLFSGRLAVCEAITTDKYDRVVARCSVDGQDVGHELVSEGLAFAYRKYADEYVFAEKGAAIRDAGLHAGRVQNPSDFRKTHAAASGPADPACVIKGNISSTGTKIYHTPGQRYYARTGIRTDQDERWFCSAADARAAGWRAAKR